MGKYKFNSAFVASKTGYGMSTVRRKASEITKDISIFAFKDAAGEWWFNDRSIAALLIMRTGKKVDGYANSQEFALAKLYDFTPNDKIIK